MAEIIRDTLPMCQAINRVEEIACRKHGIPTMRGVLYQQLLDDNGNPILKKINDNTVVIGGAIQALQYLFGVEGTTDSFKTPYKIDTVNVIEGVNTATTYNERNCTIKCFGVGTGGAPLDFGTPYDPDFKQRMISDWIPFKVSDTDTLDIADQNKYYWRKQISSDPAAPQYAWYLKEFEQTPTLHARWKDTTDPTADGTELVADPYDSSSTNLIECYGECLLKIDKDDIRPYFEYAGRLPMARYNTIGLFSGVKQLVDASGRYDYVGLRLFSVVTLDNVSVKLPTECSYIYRIYSAV